MWMTSAQLDGHCGSIIKIPTKHLNYSAKEVPHSNKEGTEKLYNILLELEKICKTEEWAEISNIPIEKDKIS